MSSQDWLLLLDEGERSSTAAIVKSLQTFTALPAVTQVIFQVVSTQEHPNRSFDVTATRSVATTTTHSLASIKTLFDGLSSTLTSINVKNIPNFPADSTGGTPKAGATFASELQTALNQLTAEAKIALENKHAVLAENAKKAIENLSTLLNSNVWNLPTDQQTVQAVVDALLTLASAKLTLLNEDKESLFTQLVFSVKEWRKNPPKSQKTQLSLSYATSKQLLDLHAAANRHENVLVKLNELRIQVQEVRLSKYSKLPTTPQSSVAINDAIKCIIEGYVALAKAMIADLENDQVLLDQLIEDMTADVKTAEDDNIRNSLNTAIESAVQQLEMIQLQILDLKIAETVLTKSYAEQLLKFALAQVQVDMTKIEDLQTARLAGPIAIAESDKSMKVLLKQRQLVRNRLCLGDQKTGKKTRASLQLAGSALRQIVKKLKNRSKRFNELHGYIEKWSKIAMPKKKVVKQPVVIPQPQFTQAYHLFVQEIQQARDLVQQASKQVAYASLRDQAFAHRNERPSVQVSAYNDEHMDASIDALQKEAIDPNRTRLNTLVRFCESVTADEAMRRELLSHLDERLQHPEIGEAAGRKIEELRIAREKAAREQAENNRAIQISLKSAPKPHENKKPVEEPQQPDFKGRLRSVSSVVEPKKPVEEPQQTDFTKVLRRASNAGSKSPEPKNYAEQPQVEPSSNSLQPPQLTKRPSSENLSSKTPPPITKRLSSNQLTVTPPLVTVPSAPVVSPKQPPPITKRVSTGNILPAQIHPPPTTTAAPVPLPPNLFNAPPPPAIVAPVPLPPNLFDAPPPNIQPNTQPNDTQTEKEMVRRARRK